MNFRGAALGVVIVVLCLPEGAHGADLPDIRQSLPPPPVFSWSGIYVGAMLGGGSGLAAFSDPRGPSIYGDSVRTPFFEGGGTIGYNYRLPASRVVLGVEADGGAVELGGTGTCLAQSGFTIPDNCRVNGVAMTTGTGRLGYALGTDGRTLAFVRGGVAALFGESDVTANNSVKYGGPFSVFDDRPRVGFTVGAGVEQALSAAWSLKLEYDFTDFGSTVLRTPLSQTLGPGYTTVATGPTTSSLSLHELKVGLNYHFGATDDASASGAGVVAEALAPTGWDAALAPPSYTLEVGGRYWYSFGRFQKDLARPSGPNTSLNSRLTYSDESSSGEIFGRIDTPARIFVKGFAGVGGEMGGQHDDEDFRPGTYKVPVAYSNTVSGQTGTLDYATIDIGYTLLRTGSAELGGFVGYNYYKSNSDGLGCQQIANPNADCSANPRPQTIIGISEDDRYDSVRVGANAKMQFDRLSLDADAAFLPFVGFQGVDDHLFRTGGPSPEFGRGQGMQLELIAAYALTPRLSLGLGGRYWAMWIPNAATDMFSGGTIQQLPVHAERYGLTTSLAYKFGDVASEPVVAKY